VVAVLLLLGLEFVCLGLLALLRFRAAGSVLINLQLQRLLVVLGVALEERGGIYDWNAPGDANLVRLRLPR
jgi:hypothetical protein